MQKGMQLPEEIIQQFRTVSLERLERVETAWESVLTTLDDAAVSLIHREIHTLKGDSKMVGFTDVNLVCHKLEDLFEVARTSGYAVDEDFDLAVNMALRFMAMLVRKKANAQLAGIDLPGFVREIDRVLADARCESGGRTRQATPHRMSGSASRAAALFRERLTPIALDLFLEYAAARDSRRNRLRNSWFSLRDLVGVHRAVIGTGQLVKHQVGAYALARELGKSIEVSLDVGSAEVTTDVLATFDLAVLHLIRNAIDHGIEGPAARALAGKPAVGKIRIRGGMMNHVLELSIEDDGGGIAFERVRQRAKEMGLTAPSDETSQHWVELLCHPGLSTRRQATYVSGRGAGLDAVAASVTEIGGSLAMSSRAGAGTTWTIKIPIASLQISGHMFRAPGVPAPIIVDQTWQVVGYETGEVPEVDIAALLGFGIDDVAPGFSLMFVRDDRAITIRAEGIGARVEARKLVVTPSSEIAEIVTNDGIESLLLRPDNLRAQ